MSRFRMPAAVAVAAALVAPALAAANAHSYFDCRVTGSSRLDHFGREGQAAELSHFTCRVHGGLLDGFVATGTNIWEPGKGQDVLLGSIVVVRKAESAVVYEVQHAVRRAAAPDARSAGWEGAGRGTYKLATGSAAPLAGKTFRAVAHYGSGTAGTFTLETVLDE